MDQAPIADLTVPGYHRSVGAVSWGSNPLHAFAVGGDTHLYHKQWNNASNISEPKSWTYLSGSVNSHPVLISFGSFLGIFVLSNDGAALVKYYDGNNWFPSRMQWASLGGHFSSALAAANAGPPSGVHVFGKGDDNSYFHASTQGGYRAPNWESLGGDFASEPAVVSWGANRLDLFGRGSDGSFLWKYWNGITWSAGWQNLGGSFVSPPTAVSKEFEYLTIFGIDQNGALLTKWFENGAWSSGWQNLGGSLLTTISVQPSKCSGTYRYDIFGVDKDQVLSQLVHDGRKWTSWVQHFGPFISAPAVTSSSCNDLHVFAINPENNLVHQAKIGDDWSPSISSGDNLGGSFKNFA